MPIIKSAKKELRKNKRKRARNIVKQKTLKTLIKQARLYIKEKNIDKAKEMLPQIYKTLDKTAKSGIIKKNTASRNKSRITIAINKLTPKNN